VVLENERRPTTNERIVRVPIDTWIPRRDLGGPSVVGIPKARSDEGDLRITPRDIVECCVAHAVHADVGRYLRRCAVHDDALVNEVKRILRLLPQEGLIIDVRGNPGGMVQTGERLLQLFTPRFIQPENFHMICTPLTLELSKASSHLKPWIDSVEQGFETGSAFSQGFTLTPEDVGNREGQIYQGPVLLITNALCYSTTDMFAGGFADHEIGEILGTSGDTGAGGANVWRYSDLARCLPAKFPALPRGAQVTVALRRSTRVGDHSGVPVEDLGVVPTLANRLTKIAAEARKPGQG
jgi:hypothetical protein